LAADWIGYGKRRPIIIPLDSDKKGSTGAARLVNIINCRRNAAIKGLNGGRVGK